MIQLSKKAIILRSNKHFVVMIMIQIVGEEMERVATECILNKKYIGKLSIVNFPKSKITQNQ